MSTALAIEKIPAINKATHEDITELNIKDAINDSWKKVAPFWPLKNLIAVNPLQGFEDHPFEEALAEGAAYFQQKNIPEPLLAINRETIKWCQAFFDEGQATIPMPYRKGGLFKAWRRLALHDDCLFEGRENEKSWFKALPEQAESVIADSLLKLGIAPKERTEFLTLVLLNLPGWAAHIKYRTDWTGA